MFVATAERASSLFVYALLGMATLGFVLSVVFAYYLGQQSVVSPRKKVTTINHRRNSYERNDR